MLQGCGAAVTESLLVGMQTVIWKTIWQFIIKLTLMTRQSCSFVFAQMTQKPECGYIAALFMIAKTWKQPTNCDTSRQWNITHS